MTDTDRYRLAALARCQGMGSRRLRQALEGLGSVAALWDSDVAALRDHGQLGERLAQRVVSWRRDNESLPEQLYADCQHCGAQLITLLDAEYPYILKEIFDAPVVLYYRGTLQPEAERSAMVGSRRFTPYGESVAKQIGQQLAAAGVTVVSGAARGIDSASHRGALQAKDGRTVAVLGCGIDIAYPRENRRLLEQIAAQGTVLSEYAPGTQPLPVFFPARNRIIAGLSRGTIVVEAARRSGSLITAEMALAEGRDVFAVPGSIYSPTSAGCHYLIQQGAKLIQNADDVLSDYGRAAPPPPARRRLNLTPEERSVYQVLSYEHPLSMDEIVMSLPDTIEIASLSFILLQMEMKGYIEENELHAYRRAGRE